MARLLGNLIERAIYPRTVEAWRAVVASTDITIEDELLEVDSNAGAVDLRLPAASSVPSGTVFEAVQVGGGNVVQWLPAAGDSINGVVAGFSWTTNGIRACRIESNGALGWQVLETDSSAGAAAATIALNKIKSVNGQIAIGATQHVTADLGLGSLAGKRIVVSIVGAAFDATLTKVIAVGNAGGQVTVTGDAAATAAVDVSIFVDTR
jgi:hypothetical protein